MASSNYRAGVHLWMPNLFNFKGGIQVYSDFFLSALQKLYPQVDYDVCLMHDSFVPPERKISLGTKFHFAGSWPQPLRTSAFLLQILKLGYWQRPDLVISTHLNFTPAAQCLKRLQGIPYWTVAHGIEAWDIQRPRLQAALQGAERILAVSHYTRDRLLQEQSLDPSRVSVLPNTFDPSRFQIGPKPRHLLERYGLDPQQPILLTVARLTDADRYKGYEQIIAALPQVREAIPNVHYLIVGKGKDQPRIEALIRRKGLQNAVTLAGFVPDQELCDYYNLCDLFVMPSKREGFGIVYLEALACGKPAIGGNQDGAVDALCRGEIGALVNPDDVGEIAHTIVSILKGTYPNPLLYQPETLRQQVIQKFGFSHYTQGLGELLPLSRLGAAHL